LRIWVMRHLITAMTIAPRHGLVESRDAGPLTSVTSGEGAMSEREPGTGWI